MRRCRRGGIISGFLVIVTILAIAFLATGIHVEHGAQFGRDQTRVETRLGSFQVDARRNVNPESAGVPVYPGAVRMGSNGSMLNFDWDGETHKAMSLAAAEFTTSDPPEKVRDFYRSRLPHGIMVRKRGSCLSFEFSRQGYKSIVAIDEHEGRTHIALASAGNPGAN